MKRATWLGFLALFALWSWGCKGNFFSNTSCIPSCAAKECGGDGCGGICGTCGPGLSCSNEGTCVSSFCGNGRLDPGEACDSAIASGQEGACATACEDDMNACTMEQFFGNPLDCDAQCKRFTTIDCRNDDGCCPPQCTNATDNDCSATCGNGMIDQNETCDGDCPAEADCMDEDADACTAPTLTGSADNCSAACAEVTIEACVNDDGCCPATCTVADDNDCDFVCGDGVLSGAEQCDNMIPAGMPDACPADIATDCPPDNDNDACTVPEILGMATDCTARCNLRTITMPANDDGCCPPTGTPDNDNDCMAVCGNNVVENPELCDSAIPAGTAGYCPVDPVVDCDDMDACTTDAITGTAAACDAQCTNTDIMACINADGCCYFACTVAMDDDCNALCDSYCMKAITNCVGADAIFADDNMSGDAMDECMTACAAYSFTVGTDADFAENTLWCRINHLDLAANDAATHCPHAVEVSPVCNM